LETALELFEKMMEHGCTPGVNTYAKLIIGVCKVGRWGVANSLFNHMIERGLVPNEDIYNALLSCCCELRMLSSAARLVEAMMEHGHLPLLESCKLLLCGLYDEGENEKAKAVFVHLLLCGYNYDEVAWKILIDGLLKSGLADRCSELLSVMEKRGCQIDPLTYTKLIEGLDGSHGT
jgi:pentatricopeptide repeat protein